MTRGAARSLRGRGALLVLFAAACHPSPPVSTPSSSRVIVARPDPSLSARVVRCEPLVYAESAPPALDRPPHVRAASGLGRFSSGWLIAQDDASFLAVRSDDGRVSALPLPAGADGRRQFSEALGNKALKLDLESIAELPDGRLVAFGSGSTERRERIAIARMDMPRADIAGADIARADIERTDIERTDIARPDGGELEDAGVVVRDGAALYAALRSTPAFSGSELNVEGAVVVDGALRLFQRGNGAVIDGVAPVSATADLPIDAFVQWLDGAGPLPPLSDVTRYDLGAAELGGGGAVPYGFTDAAARPGGGVIFVAGAEDSPDTYADGEVLGARVGVIDGSGARFATLRGEDGAPTRLKVEGIAVDPAGLPRAWAVTDVDDPDRPALFCELALEGPWGG